MKDYPKSINDLNYNNTYFIERDGSICMYKNFVTKKDKTHHLDSPEDCNSLKALTALMRLRDKYNEIDNYIPEWDGFKRNHCIVRHENSFVRIESVRRPHVLAFSCCKTRDMFYNRFKDLIYQAKMFL